MKSWGNFILLLVLTAITVLTWFTIGVRGLTREDYLNEKTLDTASPLNATIDVEFLKKLRPAYEQQ